MTWCACNGLLDDRRTKTPPTQVTPVGITGSVGVNGLNRLKDVKIIQNALNHVCPEDGGPCPKLSVDGDCGKLTKAAITKFQKTQFPEGHKKKNKSHWEADGLIDVDKWTIARLNEMRNKAPLLARAREWSGVALDLIRSAIVRLVTVRSSFTLPNPLFPNTQLKRDAEWCFKVHRADDPVAQIDSALVIYERMSKTLHRYLSGSFPLFQLSEEFSLTAIAYAYWGGHEWGLDESHPKTNEQGAYIYIGNDTFNGPNVIVHELGHYCGGREGSGKEIGHRYTPNPKPHGKPGDDGRPGRNFLTMTPADALLNVYSYQIFARAPAGFGPPEQGPV